MSESERERWLCCRSMRRTKFCPECGAEKPEVVGSSEGDTLADEFQAEAAKCFRTADTFANQAESIRCEHVLSEYTDDNEWQTWGDVVRHRENSAKGHRERGNKFARYERIVRELIEKSST